MKKLSKIQFYLLGGGLASVITAIIMALIWYSDYLSIIALFLLSIPLFFAVRLPDSWKMGLEIFYFFTFVYSFVFGLWFTLPLIIIAFYFVFKVRPDELNGCLCHYFVLTSVALAGRYFHRLYGLGIAESTFVFAALIAITIGLAVDTFIALKIAPVPFPKLMINHSLDFLVNYFIITTFGFKIFQFFVGMV